MTVGNASRWTSVHAPTPSFARDVAKVIFRCTFHAVKKTLSREKAAPTEFEEIDLPGTAWTHRIRRSPSFIGASLMLATLRRMNPSALKSHSSTPYDRNHWLESSCHSYSKLTAMRFS